MENLAFFVQFSLIAFGLKPLTPVVNPVVIWLCLV